MRRDTIVKAGFKAWVVSADRVGRAAALPRVSFQLRLRCARRATSPSAHAVSCRRARHAGG
ncbi:hypothetical protein ACIBSV_30040 [Embleya sp. NPDC050154]|uniref:hypothetical protein n=1 Tax=Embleya sp. NPDC050154 TaxID=3363988 RepID=UPI0037A79DAA